MSLENIIEMLEDNNSSSNVLDMELQRKEEEFKRLNDRLDKADEYFRTLPKEKLENIEDTKAYNEMIKIIHKLCKLSSEIDKLKN